MKNKCTQGCTDPHPLWGWVDQDPRHRGERAVDCAVDVGAAEMDEVCWTPNGFPLANRRVRRS